VKSVAGWYLEVGWVTDGLALLAAWAGFLLLLGLLAFVVLHGSPGSEE